MPSESHSFTLVQQAGEYVGIDQGDCYAKGVKCNFIKPDDFVSMGVECQKHILPRCLLRRASVEEGVRCQGVREEGACW